MKFGILIFNQVEELDFVGPWEMLTLWRAQAGGPETCLVVAPTLAPITCAKGLSVNPHASFETCPDLDYLLVPGGMGTRTEVNNPVLVAFIARQARTCKAVLSVCTGSFLLHAAGLLSGKRATTHWGSLDRLRALGDVEVLEQRHVQDGRIWTSAGIAAGTDQMRGRRGSRRQGATGRGVLPRRHPLRQRPPGSPGPGLPASPLKPGPRMELP